VKNDPQISVVVAARDASATVGKAVASALRQPETREVIVVDDGSIDATADAASGADDGSDRVRVLRLGSSLGPSAARNRAIAAARGALIAVLDADDHLADGRFTRMLAAATDWDLLADDIRIAPASAPDAPTATLLDLSDGLARTLDAAVFVRGNLADPRRPRRELGFLKPLMKRRFLADHGLAYDESVRLGEDFVLYTQALLRGARFLLVPACGYIAVDHAGSLSNQHGVAELAALAAADTRLIEEARASAPAVAAVLEAHRRGVRLKLDHRLLLDAKARGDWPETVRRLLRTPATTAYILGQTVEARLQRRRRAAAQAVRGRPA
jgi:succinoglycan biosynthesis protein ExoU